MPADRVEVFAQISPELRRNLKHLGDKAGREMGRALKGEGDKVIKTAIPLTPRASGVLRESGGVARPRRKEMGTFVEVPASFGGKKAWYAIIVHERLDVRHKIGQAKFLQEAFNKESRSSIARVGRYIRNQVLKRMVGRVTG